VADSYEYNNEHSASIKVEEFLHKPSDYICLLIIVLD
jgi:hypothetical protein